LVPPEQLPRGFKPGQEMQAIQALRKEQLRYSHMPNGQTDAKFYGDWAKRIQDSIAPIAVRPGETFVSPTDARTIYQAPQANLKDLALRRFMEEHPDATAAEIQKFNAQGRPQRSSAAMALQRYIEEHPDATSEDIQKFTAAQTAITRFGSGKQGDTIKSFNVLVDHLASSEKRRHSPLQFVETDLGLRNRRDRADEFRWRQGAGWRRNR
jgi:hypothetical protein